MVATSEVWRFLFEIRFPVPLFQNRPYVQPLHLESRPFGLPKEFEARFLRRIALEAVDADHFAQFQKAVFLDEKIHDHGERDAVEHFVVAVVLGILHIGKWDGPALRPCEYASEYTRTPPENKTEYPRTFWTKDFKPA